MTDANIKQLIERLRQRSSSRHMLLTDPPKPAPDADCHAAADMLEQYLATKQELSAFRQEVSDAVINSGTWNVGKLKRFIIPAPKPDPLVEVLQELDIDVFPAILHEALKLRGLQIVGVKNDD